MKYSDIYQNELLVHKVNKLFAIHLQYTNFEQFEWLLFYACVNFPLVSPNKLVSVLAFNQFKQWCNVAWLLWQCCDQIYMKSYFFLLLLSLISSNQPCSLFITIKVNAVKLSHRDSIFLIAGTWLTWLCVRVCVFSVWGCQIYFQINISVLFTKCTPTSTHKEVWMC